MSQAKASSIVVPRATLIATMKTLRTLGVEWRYMVSQNNGTKKCEADTAKMDRLIGKLEGLLMDADTKANEAK